MNKIRFICLVIILSWSTNCTCQIQFLGLTQKLDDMINVIYNKDNYGEIKSGDTLYVIDVSSIHRFVVEDFSKDSLDFYNFIGGEDYQENGKSLSYFNNRIRAKYIDTELTGDYLLSRELGIFFSLNNYFFCFKLNEPVKKAKYLNKDQLKLNGFTYNFLDSEVKTTNAKTNLISSFKLTLSTSKNFQFVVAEHTVKSINYILVYFNNILITKIFKGFAETK